MNSMRDGLQAAMFAVDYVEVIASVLCVSLDELAHQRQARKRHEATQHLCELSMRL
jgi:hypothetical protein